MSTTHKPSVLPATSIKRTSSIEQVLGRLDGALALLAKSGAFAGALAMTLAPSLGGCAVDVGEPDEDLGEAEEKLIGNGQSDWAQQQGQRNTYWVDYYQESWWAYNYTTCSSRFCPQFIDLFLKVAVRPAAGANLDFKKVGIVYRAPGTNQLTTVNGYYFTTWNNGQEEWHIKVTLPSSQGLVSFNAWYQDGKGNTFYDDNGGELNVATAGPNSIAVVQLGGAPNTTVAITANGVEGTVSARLADIDYDKQVAMVYTLDDWETSHWIEMGEGQNAWHWAEDYGPDYERWAVDLNLPGNFTRMEYAIRYRHGVANGAQASEFWDNNHGQNYVVSRAP